MRESGQQTTGKAQLWDWPLDFSFSLELMFLKHLPKLDSTWGISDQPPLVSMRAARSTGRCPRPHTFHHFWAVGGSYIHANETGFLINSPFHSRVKNRDSCSLVRTPTSAPAPPESSLRVEKPRCFDMPSLARPSTGCFRGDLQGHLAFCILGLPETSYPGAELRPGPGTRRRGCRPPPASLPLPAAPRRPRTAPPPPLAAAAGVSPGIAASRRRCAQERGQPGGARPRFTCPPQPRSVLTPRSPWSRAGAGSPC